MPIRSLPHKLDIDRIRENLYGCEEARKEFSQEKKVQLKAKNPDYFIYYIEKGLDGMNVALYLGKELPEVVKWFRSTLPELKVAIDFGYAFHCEEFRKLLLATIAFGDQKSIELLCAMSVDSYRNPNVEMSECAYAIVEAIQAAAKGKAKTFKTKVVEAEKLLNPKQLIVDRKGEEAEFTPLVALLRAVADKDQCAWEDAWRRREQYWKKAYGRKNESANRDGILDRELLGIARLAEQYGLIVPTSNPYAPIELLRAAEGMK